MLAPVDLPAQFALDQRGAAAGMSACINACCALFLADAFNAAAFEKVGDTQHHKPPRSVPRV